MTSVFKLLQDLERRFGTIELEGNINFIRKDDFYPELEIKFSSEKTRDSFLKKKLTLGQWAINDTTVKIPNEHFIFLYKMLDEPPYLKNHDMLSLVRQLKLTIKKDALMDEQTTSVFCQFFNNDIKNNKIKGLFEIIQGLEYGAKADFKNIVQESVKKYPALVEGKWRHECLDLLVKLSGSSQDELLNIVKPDNSLKIT